MIIREINDGQYLLVEVPNDISNSKVGTWIKNGEPCVTSLEFYSETFEQEHGSHCFEDVELQEILLPYIGDYKIIPPSKYNILIKENLFETKNKIIVLKCTKKSLAKM